MRKTTFLRNWSLAVGAVDTVAGLLLILAPLFVLRLLGTTPPSDNATVFPEWVGVFMLSVGLSYGLGLIRGRYGEAVWFLTAFVRLAVAVFVTARIQDGLLEPRWMLLGIAYSAMACVQFYILRAGWWKTVPP